MSVQQSFNEAGRFSIAYNLPATLVCYGLAHAMVDATCAGVVFAMPGLHSMETSSFVILVVIYNTLAFGTQFLTGMLVDKFKAPRLVAGAGCVITASSCVAVMFSPLLAVCLAGIGNSLFHVGGGAISLNLTPDKATAPGIFVAPGGVGLLIGGLIGKGGFFVAWPFIVLLGLCCLAFFVLQPPVMNYEHKKLKFEDGIFEIIILLLLFSVSIRALIALCITMPLKTNMALLFTLIFGVSFGKALGGVIADRVGWLKVAVAALLISAPMLAFGKDIAFVAILGAFIFQFTMPITLVAIATMLPGRPGFAFGLPCLALLFGALPSFTEYKVFFDNNIIILITILISAAAVFAGLKMYFKSGVVESK